MLHFAGWYGLLTTARDGAILKLSACPKLNCDRLGCSAVLQIRLGFLVATSPASIVAGPRAFPAIVMSASDTGGCCSASPSRRVLTLWSWSPSSRIASQLLA